MCPRDDGEGHDNVLTCDYFLVAAVEQPSEAANAEPAAATTEIAPTDQAAPADASVNNKTDETAGADTNEPTDAPAPQPTASTNGLKKNKSEKKGSFGSKIKGFFKKL